MRVGGKNILNEEMVRKAMGLESSEMKKKMTKAARLVLLQARPSWRGIRSKLHYLVRAMDSRHFEPCAECTFPEFEPAYETH